MLCFSVQRRIDAKISEWGKNGGIFTNADMMDYLVSNGHSYAPTSRELGKYLMMNAVMIGQEFTMNGYVSYWRASE